MKTARFSPRLLGLGAIALWAPLGTLAASVSQLPALVTVGWAFCIGGALACLVSPPRGVPATSVVVAAVGLLGSHVLYFQAMRWAPAAEVVVVNYVWPLLLVLAAPLVLREARWRPRTLLAAALGFGAIAWLLWDPEARRDAALAPYGWAASIGSAIVWAAYSLSNARWPEAAAGAVGPGLLVSGVLALGYVALDGTWQWPAGSDAVILLALGVGPTGLAFLLWTAALRAGDAQWLGVLANVTPIASTCLLIAFGHATASSRLAVAVACVVVATLLASGTRRDRGG